MTLPTIKNVPGLNPLNKKMLIHAAPKVGKSTLVSQLYPDAIFIATDPTGLEELEVFQVLCRSWTDFRQIGTDIVELLKKDGFPYDAIVVDTADELSRFCAHDVLAQLPGGPTKGFLHASDWDYGKAWNAISEEYRLRVAKLCNLGLPVVFVSHSKTTMKKNRTGLEITVNSPDLGSGQARDWLLKFVDYIFYAEIVQTSEGEARLLHTQPSETYLAGGRVAQGADPLPDPLPLDGVRLRAALQAMAKVAEQPVGPWTGDGPDPGHEEAPEVEGQAPPRKPVRQRKEKVATT